MPTPPAPQRPASLNKLTVSCFVRAKGGFSEAKIKASEAALTKGAGWLLNSMFDAPLAASPESLGKFVEMVDAAAVKIMRPFLDDATFEVEALVEVAVGDAFRLGEPLADLKIIDGKLAEISRQQPRPAATRSA